MFIDLQAKVLCTERPTSFVICPGTPRFPFLTIFVLSNLQPWPTRSEMSLTGEHKFTKESGAALVFGIGYFILFLWMIYAYATHRIKRKSRYSILFFHIAIRIASQGCGVAFGILGFDNPDVFLAYLILGAEGYFTLVICAYRFLISWHQHNLPSKESFLEPRETDKSRTRRKILIMALIWPAAPFIYWRNFMVWMHTFLILANIAIVTGGSYLAGADYTQPDLPETRNRMQVSKITRVAGQSVFLACNFILLFSIIRTLMLDKREVKSKGEGKIHPTLILLFVTWFPLIVRGVFGVLQSGIWGLSYYNPENYNSKGFTDRFIAIEYCLGVLPEWLSAALLLCTYGTSRGDPTSAKEDSAVKNGEVEKSESA
ncbi:hypothetical protein DL96DRAFT_520782 [Flagelloscypha sp. PMI_526]|nr:hypothetical protein DL96DRAFT_520782 [Flagelloscypha sp. PMI_526]